jgi:hypothetical protein
MWNETNFSNGIGRMSYDKFAYYCDQLGADQAVWVAKYFGIALHTVKSYLRLYKIS